MSLGFPVQEESTMKSRVLCFWLGHLALLAGLAACFQGQDQSAAFFLVCAGALVFGSYGPPAGGCAA